VHAIRGIQADPLAIGLRLVVDHLVDIRRTEVLARAAKFFNATAIANVGIVNDQVRRLVFLVLCARMIEIGELVECKFAVPLCAVQKMRLPVSIALQIGYFFHALITGSRWIPVTYALPSGDLL